VQTGRMAHDDAERNLAALERDAHAGHSLQHGTGADWTPAEVHEFIRQARTALKGHQQAQKRTKPPKVTKDTPPKATPAKEPPGAKKPVSTPDAKTVLDIPAQIGKESRVISSSNATAHQLGVKDIATRFAVVEAGDVIHSLDRRYPQELQPRLERQPGSTDLATETTVSRILGNLDFESLTESRQASLGAPLVEKRGYSISGTGRLEALKRLYQRGGDAAQAYKQFLQDEAQRFGLDADAIGRMRAPVLVRAITTKMDSQQLAAFADEANQRETQAPGPISIAVQDSKRLTPDVLSLMQPNEDGTVDLLGSLNRSFREAVLRQVIPASEHGSVLAQGQWTADGAARLRRAVFARAYGNTPALERLVSSESPERKNLGSALLSAAPAFTRLRGEIEAGHLHDRQITGDLMQAVNKLVALSAQGETVANWVAQSALFDEGLSPLAKDLVQVLDRPLFKRSAQRMTELMHTYIEGVEALGDPRQAGMFGAATVPSPAAILSESLQRVEAGDGGKQSHLFGPRAA
jgi:hypothetical protein